MLSPTEAEADRVRVRISGERALGWSLLLMLVTLQCYGLYASAEQVGVDLFPGVDKLGHFAAFAAPTLIAGLLRSRLALTVLLLHALTGELLQLWFTSDRVADPWDAVTNVAGWVVGLAVARLLLRYRPGRDDD